MVVGTTLIVGVGVGGERWQYLSRVGGEGEQSALLELVRMIQLQ